MKDRVRANWLQRRYCVAVIVLVFYTVDTLAVRLLLAWASFVYAGLMIWPDMLNLVQHAVAQVPMGLQHSLSDIHPGFAHLFAEQDRASVFSRPAYAIMALWPGGIWLWFVLFMAHGIGVHWRIVDPVERQHWALAINVLGLAVWAYSTASLCISLGQILPTVALEVVVIFFGFWVMVRTGLTKELVTA